MTGRIAGSLTAAAALTLGGCATIHHGRNQLVTVESAPPGQTVHIEPGGITITTPAVVPLLRKESYVATIVGAPPVLIEGHASSWLWGNLIWIHPLGIGAGLIVDMSTGSGYQLPDRVIVPTGEPAEVTP